MSRRSGCEYLADVLGTDTAVVVRYCRRVELEQSVRRWAASLGVGMPEMQVARLAKFLDDWTRP